MSRVISILKDVNGNTIGAKVTDGFVITNMKTEVLKRYSGKKVFDNAIIDKNGFVKAKEGNLSIEVVSNYMILYHGSKSGIQFPIRIDYSSNLCDFGKGFYIGSDVNQAINRVCWEKESYIYKFKLSLDGIKVYTFNDDTLWALYVGYNRNKIDISNYPKLVRKFKEINNCDVIVGLIADDKIAGSFTEFIEGNLTDKALSACLKEVKYGNQYVIKSQAVCNDKLEVLDSIVLSTDTKELSKEWGKSLKENLSQKLFNIKAKYRREGKYIDEVLEVYK